MATDEMANMGPQESRWTLWQLFTNRDVMILMLMGIVGNAGGFGLGVFVQGPATAYAFGTRAAMVTNINCIGTPLVALFLSVPFARWADSKKDPRLGLAWVIVGAQSPSFAMLFNGFTNPGKRSIWGFVIWCGVVGPMRCQLSGNPVLWATYADKVPPEMREFGFQLLATLPSLATLGICPLCVQVLDWYPFALTGITYIQIFQVTFIVGFFLSLLLVFLLSSTRSEWTLAALEERKESGEEEQEAVSAFNYCKVIGNAFNFFSSNRVLLAVAGALSVYTLPDLAASYPSGQIYYTVQQIAVASGNHTAQSNRDQQNAMSNWMTNWPTILGFFINIAIALLCRKYGGARVMVGWVPVTCTIFAAPFFLYWQWAQCPLGWIFIALSVGLSGSVFPALQALVTLAVPVERVGEALGCVAMCKDFMSLLAPIFMMVVMGAMDAVAGDDPHELAGLYRWIFPGCAVLMWTAWPFVIYLAFHVNTKLPEIDEPLFASSALQQFTGADYAASIGAVIAKKATAARNLTSSLRETVHDHDSMLGSRVAASDAHASLRDSEVKS